MIFKNNISDIGCHLTLILYLVRLFKTKIHCNSVTVTIYILIELTNNTNIDIIISTSLCNILTSN